MSKSAPQTAEDLNEGARVRMTRDADNNIVTAGPASVGTVTYVTSDRVRINWDDRSNSTLGGIELERLALVS